jgi:hypothetical protein
MRFLGKMDNLSLNLIAYNTMILYKFANFSEGRIKI